MLWGYWVKQNKTKTKQKNFRVNNTFESDFPGSCTNLMIYSVLFEEDIQWWDKKIELYKLFQISYI